MGFPEDSMRASWTLHGATWGFMGPHLGPMALAWGRSGKDLHRQRRRNRVRGIRRNSAEGKRATFEMQNKVYKKKRDRGLFYTIDGFLNLHAADRVFPNLRSKVKFIVEELNQKVVKDEDGILGVEYSAIPTGALYEYERGSEKANEVISLTQFDCMQEAGDFADQSSKDRGILPKVVASPEGEQSEPTQVAASQSCASMSSLGSNLRDSGQHSDVHAAPGEEGLVEDDESGSEEQEEHSDEDSQEIDVASVVSCARTKTANSAQTVFAAATPVWKRNRQKGRARSSEVKVADTAQETQQKGRKKRRSTLSTPIKNWIKKR